MPPRIACRPGSAPVCSTSPVRAGRPRPVLASRGADSGCDYPASRGRMKAVNAVTTSWPALRVDRPTFSAVAESELDTIHPYLLSLTGHRTVAEDVTGQTVDNAF